MNIIDKIISLEHEASDFGFAWENPEQIMAQIKDECAEVLEHLNQGKNLNRDDLQEEIGDLFHAVFSLCVFCELDPESTIKQTTNKFERRLRSVKTIAKEQNKTTLKGETFENLMRIWQDAKHRVG